MITPASFEESANFDPVEKPRHYQHTLLKSNQAIETIDYIEAVLGNQKAIAYCHGSALKYLSRANKKESAAQDFKKAAWFATRAANLIDSENK